MATQTIDLGQVFDPEVAAAADNNALSLNGGYDGRSIKDLLGCSTWDETYTALSAKKHSELGFLRLGDYLDVTLTSAAYTQQQTLRFVVADVDPYYQCGDTAISSHHIAFVAATPIAVASSVTGAANTSYLQWNTTNTNNGTSSDKHPYTCSQLKGWEKAFEACLPEGLTKYILTQRVLLEERYSASGALTASNGWSWADIGKIWSPSEMEVYGCTVWGTPGYSVGFDCQFDLFKDTAHRLNGTRYTWWLRSVGGSSSANVCCVYGHGHALCNDATDGWVRPRPGFLFKLAG